MRPSAALLPLCLLATLQAADDPPRAPPIPPCNDFRIQYDPSLSNQQRTCVWASNLLTPSAIFGAAFTTGTAQLFKTDPSQWGSGPAGYARGYGSRYAQGMAKATGEYVTGLVTREDPRHHHSPNRNFFARLWYAGSSLVIDRSPSRPAFAPVLGALSGGFVGMAWYPTPNNTVSQAIKRSETSLAGSLGYAEFFEFEPDLFRFVGKWFSPKLK